MKTVTIDARMYHSSGIGTYISNIVPLVVKSCDMTNFRIMGDKADLAKREFCQQDNITLEDYRSPIFSIHEQLAVTKYSKTDLLWVPHYNAPFIYSGKLLATVHDVFHLAMSASLFHKAYARALLTNIKLRADKIICVSQFSADEFIRHAGISASKITVIHNGVNENWFNVQKASNPHHKPYILYVGNIKPHKNLLRLLEAFESVVDKISHDLVMVGKKDGFITGDARVKEKAALLKERVHFTGHVEYESLQQYFLHAHVLVFPSLYEGFGLPPLEAMACGCPVIASDAASLPEVCGDAALYCNPYSVEDIASKIELLLASEQLRNELRIKGVEQARKFTWHDAARETKSVIDDLLR